MEKMTKTQNYEALLALLNAQENHDFDEFINHEMELLAKAKKPSKAEIEKRNANKALSESFVAYIKAHDNKVACAELVKEFDLTPSKVSSVIRMTEGVTKTEIKGKVYYSVA